MQSSSSSSSTSVSVETNNAVNLLSKLSNFAFDSNSKQLNLDGYSSILSNFVHYDRKVVDLWAGGRKKSSKIVGSLSSGSRGGSSINRFFSEFNKFVRFHCDRIPLAFASVKVNSESCSGLGEENGDVLENETSPLNGFQSNGKKKVLILMSDTGGGHRASAESIKCAFNEKFGDEYEVGLSNYLVSIGFIYLD